MKINLSPHFKRSYKKIPKHIQNDFDKKIIIFVKDLYHSSLKTHKLTGRLQECLAFYLKDGYRVLFEFSGLESIDLLEIGSHDVYKKFRR